MSLLKYCLLCSIGICGFLGSASVFAQGGPWSVGPAPKLEGGIRSGSQPIPDNLTLLLHEEKEVQLKATAIDVDNYDGGSGSVPIDDDGYINWTVSGGAEIRSPSVDSTWGPNTRTRSNRRVTVKAPLIPQGSNSFSFTVTATPDDKPGITGGEGGNRDDAPGAPKSIIIKVTNACPTGISVVTDCPHPTNWPQHWSTTGLKTNGFLISEMTVTGTPPAGQDNWDGLVVTEKFLFPDPRDPQNPANSNPPLTPAEVAKFLPGRLTQVCKGDSTFIVGAGNTVEYGKCKATKKSGAFFDLYGYNSSISIMVDGETQAITCDQQYLCGGQVIGGKTFKITRTFSDSTYTPPGGVAEARTEVVTTKN